MEALLADVSGRSVGVVCVLLELWANGMQWYVYSLWSHVKLIMANASVVHVSRLRLN